MITRLVPVRCPSDLSCTGGSAGSLWCRAAEDQCGRSFSPMPDSALCQALVRFIKRYGGKKEVINVGEVYAHLVRDLREGTNSAPGFDHALHNARLIDAVRHAAERGKRQQVLEQIESFDEARITSVG
jgi:hypothetical protein